MEDRGRVSQFSEDLQTFLFSELCLAALYTPKIKIKDLKIIIICSL